MTGIYFGAFILTFRLNEGHTVFIERKIAGRMSGEKCRHFGAIGGWSDLVYQVSLISVYISC